jgi:hypothetical protein
LVELLTWRRRCQALVQLKPQKIHQLSHYAGASSDHPDEKHMRDGGVSGSSRVTMRQLGRKHIVDGEIRFWGG